jgi:hypothetical protein
MAVDCVASSDTANEHSWRKENGVVTARKNVCVMVLGDKINDSDA